MIRPTTEDREAFSRECPAEVMAAAKAMFDRIAEIGYKPPYGRNDCAWTDLADVALRAAKDIIEKQNGAWMPEELEAMQKRGDLIPPNRHVAYETRLECLRLAIRTIGDKILTDEASVLRVANAFEQFMRGSCSVNLVNNDIARDYIKSNPFSPYVVPGTQ